MSTDVCMCRVCVNRLSSAARKPKISGHCAKLKPKEEDHMTIGKLRKLLKKVEKDMKKGKNQPIGIKTLSEDSKAINFHNIEGISHSGFEGLNICTFDDD